MATATQAAKHIFLSVSRFRDLLGTVFERQPSGRYNLDVIREAYCLHAQKVMAGRADDGGKALSEKRGRLAEAQTVAVELKNLIASREFVRWEDVQRGQEQNLSVFREVLLTTPGKVSDQVSTHTEQDRFAVFEIIYNEVCDALLILSDPYFIGPRQTYAEQGRIADIAKAAELDERRRLAAEALRKSGEMPGLAAAYERWRRGGTQYANEADRP
jgi:hypothetical protein